MCAVDHFLNCFLFRLLFVVLGFLLMRPAHSMVGPEPEFSVDVQEGCAPLAVNLINHTNEPGNISYTWKVFNNSGDTIAWFYIENPHLVIMHPGVYSVSLEAARPDEEGVTTVKKDLISVYPLPHLSFTITPAIAYLQEEVRTINFSSGAMSYSWNFGEGGWITGFEPTHTYSETGEYTIWLAGISEEGCLDTTFLKNAVRVRTGGLIQIPNAFTPSGSGFDVSNGINDTFRPVTEGALSFEMKIYDRYGNLLFVSKNHNSGWNGKNPKGQLMPHGVYFYSIKVEFSNGVVTSRAGDFTLIR